MSAAAASAAPTPDASTADAIQSPLDVLHFWFSEETWTTPAKMLEGDFLSTKSRTLWYAGTSADAACAPFAATIEAAASGALDDDPAWASQPDADFAKILLFDQLARNCFRGTERAFAYDPLALDLSLRMCSDLHLLDTAPVGMLHFLSSPLIHSEDVDDHDVALEVCSKLELRAPELARSSRPHLVAHRDVIVRFGRYPHRNRAMGRENTPEEEAWLASDQVPGWAKSQ